MRRREFITLLGGAAAASILRPGPLSSQQTQPVIGILGRTTAEEYAFLIATFRKSLAEAGYVEGQNVTIEYRWMIMMIDYLRWHLIWSKGRYLSFSRAGAWRPHWPQRLQPQRSR